MAEYTLYGFSASTYVRTVRMLFTEKGLDYDQDPVNILQGEGQSEAHLARHPFGKIPVLAWRGGRLYETDAILELLESRHPSPAFVPAEPVARATMRQWLSVVDHYAYNAIVGGVVWQRVINPMLGNRVDEQAIEAALPTVRTCLELFDQTLGDAPYLAGDEPSMADLYVAPLLAYLAQTPEGDELLAETPQLGKWWAAMQKRESFLQTAP